MEVMQPFFKTPFVDALSKMQTHTVVFSTGKKQVYAGDIYSKSLALANGLKQNGFNENDRIVIIVPPGEAFLEIFFAANMLGALLSIIDPEMGRDNFESKLRQFQPKWIFVDSRLLLLQENKLLRYLYFKLKDQPFYFSYHGNAKLVATGLQLPLFKKDHFFNNLLIPCTTGVEFTEKINGEFMVTYTSGTLAEPKGVVHSVRSLFNSLTRIKELVGENEARIAAYLPHFLLFGICSGNAVFLFDKNSGAANTIAFFEKNNITTLFGPPSFYIPLINYCQSKRRALPDSLRLLILGSAPVHPRFLEMLYSVAPSHTKITCLYGMTENLLVCQIDGMEKIHTTEAGDVVGKAFDGVELSIADDGEILVSSSQLFSRYLHQDNRESPHKTGDLGYINKEGILVLNGRKKDMIIRRDTNIYPAIYEKTIKNIPGVKEAVLIGKYSEKLHDEEVYLFVETEMYSEQQLRKLLLSGRYSIDREALPDQIIFTKIPLSGRQNKVDRKKLRELIAT